MPDIDRLKQFVIMAYEWVWQHVFIPSSLGQLLAIAMILVVARVYAGKISAWLAARGQYWENINFSFIATRIHISGREVLFLVVALVMLWTAVLIATSALLPVVVIRGAASLFTAWALIRLSSSMIKRRFWSMTVAFIMWSIAALNILGWLDRAIMILDNAAITLGKLHFSVLLVIKGILIFGLLIWGAGVLAAKLEKAVDRSKEFNPSQKVLFHKLIRAVLFAVVVLLGLKAIGIDLTALAVFGGAIGIGIGFGLQRIFANIMSGFILLMDKSIKPGDVIAIGDTYGWVNQLGTRHVSILTRDGKEHLIPNEKMITESVENWSYSDSRVRVHIPIDVSYESDIHLVKKLLLGVTRSAARVLDDPAPMCLIKGFGESGVSFELRVWIDDPINGIANIRSGIYEAVWDVFKKHDIKISVPQRDIYVRSTAQPPLPS